MSPASHSPDDFRPSAPLDNLAARANLLRRLRTFFDENGFCEVTTPVLSADTVVDLHLEPFRVRLFHDPAEIDQGPVWFLQTSPEFHMKRLLAAGAQAIYQIGPALRAGETGPLHNIEFTMLEWYRAGDNMAAGMHFLSRLTRDLFGSDRVDQRTYASVFQEHFAANPHTVSDVELRKMSAALRELKSDDDRDDLLNLLWSDGIEPKLGRERPIIILDYPATQAALAKTRQISAGGADYAVAERFELYFHGIELANGYHELTDPEEFRRRMIATNEKRGCAGKSPLPTQNRLLQAMENGFPPSTGVAMGVDRVLMLLIGELFLEKVLSFAQRKA